MKLSDAILLGSTVLTAQAGRMYLAERDAGCALGMAAIANGVGFRSTSVPVPKGERRALGTEHVWGNWVLSVVERPCECWRFRVPLEMRIKDIIAHIFDRHVMGKKDWTLERLVTWVKTVEPVEQTGPATASRTLPALRDPDVATTEHLSNRPSIEELEEWQSVRSAFSVNYDARRRNKPGSRT